MAGEHPTDDIEHGIPEQIVLTFSGEAAMTMRTLAEIASKEPGEIVAEALVVYKYIGDLVRDDVILRAYFPDGHREKLNFPKFKS